MEPPTISTPLLKFFRRIVRRYFRRHFHAVRINGASKFTVESGPLIVYANHSSWWDPMISILLASELLPKRNHYAPMDAEALERYKILKRLGVFPVEMKTGRGAVQFLRTGTAVLNAGGVLWITPQGRFADPRERPLQFKPGLAALATRSGRCTLLPLAIEYPFWDERLPEALLHVGEPMQVILGEDEDEIQIRMTSALEATMEKLKALALRRDPKAFTTLSLGTAGVGGFYALGKKLKALLQRQPYRAEHTVTHEAASSTEGRE